MNNWEEQPFTHGQLFVFIKSSKDIVINTNGVFCVLQLDNQQVQTNVVNKTNNFKFSYESWDYGCTFDITNSVSILHITVWGTNSNIISGYQIDNTDVKFVGQLKIPVISLIHQKPIEQWFKLSSIIDNFSATQGELKIQLHFTITEKVISVEDFQPLKVVGKGTFAKVMMVKKIDTGRLYAMKIIKKDAVLKRNAIQHTMSERNVLKKINHPFIVSLKYSFQTKDKLYMILDYINGGELFYHLSESERFSEERARFYAAEIICALGYLHSLNILYRDLKPENVLLDMNGHICLTDFGLCKEGLGFGKVTHTFCGSPEYLAPEIFLGAGYDKSVDWWALGTLLYEMLSGLPPFFSDDIEEMNERILFEPLIFPDYFSENAKSLLKQLLERNPKKRLGSGPTDAEEIKKHNFFNGIDWQKLEKKAIDAPFRPNLKSETDVRFFDPSSTQMVAKHSYSESFLTNQEQAKFRGFSYVAPDVYLESKRWSRRRGISGKGTNKNNFISGTRLSSSPPTHKTEKDDMNFIFPSSPSISSFSPISNSSTPPPPFSLNNNGSFSDLSSIPSSLENQLDSSPIMKISPPFQKPQKDFLSNHRQNFQNLPLNGSFHEEFPFTVLYKENDYYSDSNNFFIQTNFSNHNSSKQILVKSYSTPNINIPSKSIWHNS